jgi:hypothetical protein
MFAAGDGVRRDPLDPRNLLRALWRGQRGDGLGAPAPWRGWIEASGDMIVLWGRSFGLGQAQTLWMTAPS